MESSKVEFRFHLPLCNSPVWARISVFVETFIIVYDSDLIAYRGRSKEGKNRKVLLKMCMCLNDMKSKVNLSKVHQKGL